MNGKFLTCQCVFWLTDAFFTCRYHLLLCVLTNSLHTDKWHQHFCRVLFFQKTDISSLKTGCLRKCLCFSQIHFWFWEVCGILSLLCVSRVNFSPPLPPSQRQISVPLCTYLVLATFSHSTHWKLFPFPYAVRLYLHSFLKTYQEKMCVDCQILKQVNCCMSQAKDSGNGLIG